MPTAHPPETPQSIGATILTATVPYGVARYLTLYQLNVISEVAVAAPILLIATNGGGG